ncbi:MAG: hypothetical protein R3E39_11350 [Anaerolineae bacterium]
MINYKLTLTENTAEALEANNAGELTEAQLNNLLQAIKKSRLPFSEFEDKSRFPSSLQIICMLVAFAGLTLFPNTMFALILLIGGLTGYVTIPIILMIRRDSAYHSQLEAVSHRLLKHDFTIESYVGPVYLVSEWDLSDSNHPPDTLVDSCLIRTYDYKHRYVISKEVWQQLRPAGRNFVENVTMYLLTQPVSALLSVEAVPVPVPPTDDKILEVIGLGTDGELVFKSHEKTT